MAAYIIVSYDIVDRQGYKAYGPGVAPLLAKHGAEVLVADYGAQALEGDARGVYVILRFESEQAALDWYDDPAYAPLKKTRIGATANGSLVLAKPFVLPKS